ncbi:hypothetical protein BDEG_28207 [Batrachochytrium dendrobatidis JEL423]|uniref:Uncharacterized protein n=1 Tax=Batrachochytrium dendrobatidis (strain JEL423) TaxID=403673 RepID=A0A177WY57_BATDL|nr:hypothetical protein BDEG_28207 [Batrachochytrium dendrobatidis JEL423]
MRRSDKDSINSCDKIWPKQANLAKITKSLACKRKRKQLQAHFLFCLQLQFDSSFCPFGLGRQSLLINTIVSCYPTSRSSGLLQGRAVENALLIPRTRASRPHPPLHLLLLIHTMTVFVFGCWSLHIYTAALV